MFTSSIVGNIGLVIFLLYLKIPSVFSSIIREILLNIETGVFVNRKAGKQLGS